MLSQGIVTEERQHPVTGQRPQLAPIRAQGRAAMRPRPPGVTGALVAITVGAILTFAVTFTISGISIHTLGLIITLGGLTALAIRLARAVTGLRRRDESQR